MQVGGNRVNADLALRATARRVLAKGVRERATTPGPTTVVTALRWFVVLTLAACGGGTSRGVARHPVDTYAAATRYQEACCEHLTSTGRDQCLQGIVRVTDPQQAAVPANQASYACMAESFQCDPQTGHATSQSAQAQLECLQDL
jgi:hypothetical protein